MKEYRIVVKNGMPRSELIEMWEWDELPKEEIEKRCKEVFDLVGVHTMTTLEEYFTLMEKVNNLTYGNYEIENNGTYFALFTEPIN